MSASDVAETVLSEKQRRIVEFLRDFIEEKDYPPSIRDIQRGCDISSTSVVDYNLRRLEKLGVIRRDREVSRAIELLDGSGRGRRSVTVPLLGKIAAGRPIPTPPDSLEGLAQVEVTAEQTRGREHVFALEVEGSSMIDALINDGDIVLLEMTQSCDDGDMVAVWLKDRNETTLKKLFREGGRIRLQPMNAAMEPFYEDPENVEVQGRVLSSIRSSW
jgi:repressor LexA